MRIWFELRKAAPDWEHIVRINRINIWLAGSQAVMPIAIKIGIDDVGLVIGKNAILL